MSVAWCIMHFFTLWKPVLWTCSVCELRSRQLKALTRECMMPPQKYTSSQQLCCSGIQPVMINTYYITYRCNTSLMKNIAGIANAVRVTLRLTVTCHQSHELSFSICQRLKLCLLVTKSLNHSQCLCLSFFAGHTNVSSSFWSIVRKVTWVNDSSAVL